MFIESRISIEIHIVKHCLLDETHDQGKMSGKPFPNKRKLLRNFEISVKGRKFRFSKKN